MSSALIAMLVVIVGFFWLILATSDERTWVANNTCPVEETIIRYPAHLGGPHPAVCRPTGIQWR